MRRFQMIEIVLSALMKPKMSCAVDPYLVPEVFLVPRPRGFLADEDSFVFRILDLENIAVQFLADSA